MRRVVDCLEVFRRMRSSTGRRSRSHQRSMAERKEAASRLLEGMPAEALGLEYGVSAQTVRNWVDSMVRARQYDRRGYVPQWVNKWNDASRPKFTVLVGGAS